MYLSPPSPTELADPPGPSLDRDRRRGLFSLRVPAVVWFLGVTSFLTDLSSEMVVSVLPAYLVLEIGLTPYGYAAVDALYQGVSAVTRIVAGAAADRASRFKEIAAAGYALSALSRVLLLVPASVPAISSAVVIDRIGKGIRTAPRDALISLSVPREQLGGAFGVHRALDTAGAALGPLLAFAVLVLTARAYDVVFVVSLALAVLGVFTLVLFVHNPPRADAASGTAARATLRALLALPAFTRIVIAAGVLSIATIGDGLLYLTLQQQFGLDPTLIPMWFAGAALCYFVAAVPAGRLADRIGRRAVYLGGHMVLMAGYALLLVAPGGLLTVAGLLVAIGIFYAATDGVLAAMASHALPSQLRGTGLAVVTTLVVLGRASGSLLFGYAWTTASATGALLVFLGLLAGALGISAVALRSTAFEGRA